MQGAGVLLLASAYFSEVTFWRKKIKLYYFHRWTYTFTQFSTFHL